MMHATRSKWIALALAGLSVPIGGCGAPKSFLRNPPGWKEIELREDLRKSYDQAWMTSFDTIAKHWDIEMSDRASGYLRTAWRYGIGGGEYRRYRGRVTIKFPDVSQPTKVEVKTEAQWLEDEPFGWVTGFDTTLERDVYSELAGRLGRTVPAQ
ncbi:MAG: hypothetical protein L6Q92_08965 [Phycisphaerae bacterium]|nr:hypothetical protein [Phycisphaerae bacterium]